MPPPPTFSNPPLPKRDWNDYKPSAIKKKDIAINGLAFTLDNVFTQDECKDIIDWSENLGYIPAALGHGTRVVSHVRKSDRCLIDTPELANIIFQRIRRYLPKQFNGGNLIEVNERLRCLRYDPGGFFRKHADGFYERPDRSAISQITVQFYLNEGFEGGETTFYVIEIIRKYLVFQKLEEY